uniref:DUF834 domain-containing protein n=1 Tax=Oryza glumipatula TaxID=40148 RepID=A0A0D9YEI3_9ORYZ
MSCPSCCLSNHSAPTLLCPSLTKSGDPKARSGIEVKVRKRVEKEARMGGGGRRRRWGWLRLPCVTFEGRGFTSKETVGEAKNIDSDGPQTGSAAHRGLGEKEGGSDGLEMRGEQRATLSFLWVAKSTGGGAGAAAIGGGG